MSLKNWIFVCFCVVMAPLQAVAEEATRTITVIAEGRVAAEPDKAEITLGARHFANTAQEALGLTSTAVSAILSQMQDLGVADRDIQTASLTLGPVWPNTPRDDTGEPIAPIGFEASNSVQVTLRDLDQLGTVLDSVTQSGANSFSGLSFGLLDSAPVQDQARRQAVAEARRKAELYAQAAGVELGEVLLITEEINGGGYPSPVMMSARSEGVPIARGEVSISASVKVIYGISR